MVKQVGEHFPLVFFSILKNTPLWADINDIVFADQCGSTSYRGTGFNFSSKSKVMRLELINTFNLSRATVLLVEGFRYRYPDWEFN